MIYPITIYPNPILRQVCKDVPHDYPNLDKLIQDMYHTMYRNNGVGLATPQIGKDIRLFVIDIDGFKKSFINPNIIKEEGEDSSIMEGCLSIPGIREEVIRKSQITLKYLDENFNQCEGIFNGINARVIQHEYDHLNGILFIDRT